MPELRKSERRISSLLNEITCFFIFNYSVAKVQALIAEMFYFKDINSSLVISEKIISSILFIEPGVHGMGR